jgi:hypothetical protein
MSLPKEPLISEKENKELNKVLDSVTGPTKEEAANTVLNKQTVVEEVSDPKEIIPDNNTIDINKPDTEFEENFANYNTTLKEEKEPVRFAGVFKGITDVASDASPMYGFKSEKLVTEVKGGIVYRDATADEIKSLDELLFGSINKSQLSEGFDFKVVGTGKNKKTVPIVTPNLNSITNVDDIKEYSMAVQKIMKPYIDEAKRGKIKVEDIINQAALIGHDEMVMKILNRPKGTQFKNSAEVLKANVISIQSLFEAKRLAKLVAENKPDKGLSVKETQARYAQALGFHSAIMSSTAGNNTEVARSLMIIGHIKRYFDAKGIDAPENVAELEQLSISLPGYSSNTLKIHASNFLKFSDMYSQSNFARQVPSWLEKTGDVMSELFINSLLASPVTHQINVFSNVAFAFYQIPETAVSAGISKIRKAIIPEGGVNVPIYGNVMSKGDGSEIFFGESYAKFYGMQRALWEATQNFGKVLKTEEPLDPITKIDTRKRKAITAENLFPDLKDTAFGKTVDIMGMMYRGPGRLLIAEDEFFKTLAYRSELHALAYRHGMEIFKKTGSKKQASEASALFMQNPPPQAVAASKAKATELTFQQELEGFLGNVQGVMSHPIAKIYVPFFRTPTNLVTELVRRTPLAITMPSFRREMMAGGSRADAALGKMTMGTSLIAGFAYGAGGGWNQDIVMTGSAPRDFGGKQMWKNQGLQPYSIAFRNPDTGLFTSVSYSRFEPLSGLLAVAADYAWAANHSPNTESAMEDLTNLMINGGYAVFNYMGHLPMLQAIGDVSQLWGKEYETFDDRVQRAKQLFAGQAGQYALSVGQQAVTFGLAPETLVANYERAISPGASNTMPSSTEGDFFLLGWSEALNRWKSRNPIFNDDIPPLLSFWGEEVTVGTGKTTWEYWTPFQIKNQKYNDVDVFYNEILNGQGLRMPPRTLDGIPLTAQQYNDYIIKTNSITMEGPDGTNMNMLDMMTYVINQDNFFELPIGEMKKELSLIYADYKSAARDELLQEYPDLDNRVNDRKEFITNTGKKAKKGVF